MTSHFPIVAISLLAICPLALAQTTTYVGPGRVSTGTSSQTLVVVCDPGVGAAIGGGCAYSCVVSCFVRVTDFSGSPQPYRICSWDGTSHRDCVNSPEEMTYLSSADMVDVFVVNGVVGQIMVQ